MIFLFSLSLINASTRFFLSFLWKVFFFFTFSLKKRATQQPFLVSVKLGLIAWKLFISIHHLLRRFLFGFYNKNNYSFTNVYGTVDLKWKKKHFIIIFTALQYTPFDDDCTVASLPSYFLRSWAFALITWYTFHYYCFALCWRCCVCVHLYFLYFLLHIYCRVGV